MNAIVSLSAAMGRAVAAAQGREMWQLIRSAAADAMATLFFAEHPPSSPMEHLTGRVAPAVPLQQDKQK